MRVWIIVATLLVLWIAIVVPPWMRRPTKVKVNDMTKFKKSPITAANLRTIQFNTGSCTAESYSEFLEAIRAAVRSGETQHGIPVMRNPSTVRQVEDRYILVELTNRAGESVTLAIDVVDLYVVGYRVGENSYFFEDTPGSAFGDVFPDTWHHRLSFDSGYPDLERKAKEDREYIDLGVTPLEEAISFLYHTHERASDQNQARGLIVIIQMISEAARFRIIEGLIRERVRNQETIRPPLYMRQLENNWAPLSNAVQNSNWPVRLQRGYPDDWITIDGVTQNLIAALALMKYICRPPPRMQQSRLPFSSLLWKPSQLLSIFSNKDQYFQANDGICSDPERIIRITGRDGLCIDVKNNNYGDGNSIIVWTCHSDVKIVNQKWEIKRDGTIRSNGKCLTTYGYKPGCYVMIYDCDKAVTGATHWEFKDDGTIVNPVSGLVLTATGSKGTTLTVETDIQASRQGWLTSNNSDPFVTNIIGFKDLCLETDGNGVWIEKCEIGKAEQKWSMHADGSIRSFQNKENCITSDGLFKGSKLVIQSCGSASSSQRWLFRYDGTILSLNSGLVMDVKGSTPSLKEIIIWSPTGYPNQKWFLPMN